MRQLEQEYSEHAEGESDLKRMCQPGESCRNQVWEPTIAGAMVFEASIVREVRM